MGVIMRSISFKILLTVLVASASVQTKAGLLDYFDWLKPAQNESGAQMAAVGGLALLASLGISALGCFAWEKYSAKKTAALQPPQNQISARAIRACANMKISDYIPIPKTNDSVKICFLRAETQSGSSCGYHAVDNAQAIKYLVDQDMEITAQSIMNHKKFHRSTADIDSYTVIKEAKNNQLKDLYILGYNTEKNLVYAPQKSETCEDLPVTFKKIKDNKIPYAFFICHTGGFHWFLIAVVNRGTEKIIFCLDSLNTPMRKDDSREKILGFVYDNIAPSEDEQKAVQAQKQQKEKILHAQKLQEIADAALAQQLAKKEQEAADARYARSLSRTTR